nr:mechanosensitive ion channel domain-containing protein [uncultured Dethiosulfovibrio sp.]
MRFKGFLVFLAVLLLSGFMMSSLWAQDAPPQESKQEEVVSQDPPAENLFDREANERRIEELNLALERLASVPMAESAAIYGITEADVESRITALSSLQNFYRRLNVAIEKTSGFVEEEKKRKSEKEQAVLTLEEKPPFNLSYYDGYLQKVEDLVSSLSELRESMTREQKAIVSAQGQLEEAGQSVRLARSELESAKGTDLEQNKEWMLRRTLVREELWNVTLAYLRRSLENIRLQTSIDTLRLDMVEDVRRYIHDNLAFDQKDLDEGLARYSSREEELTKRIASLAGEVEKAEKAYADSHANLTVATSDKAQKAAQRAFSEAEIRREYLHLAASQSQEMVGMLGEMREIWSFRYSLLREEGVSTDVLMKARDDVKARVGRFENVLLSQQRYQSTLHRRGLALDKAIEEEKGKDELASLKKRRKTLDDIMSQNMNYMAVAMTLDSMNKRLLEEIGRRISSVNVAEKVTTLWKTRTTEILNTELWYSGDYAVRLKEFILALFILSLGLIASKRLARFIRKWFLLHSKNVEITAVYAVERLLYYFLIVASFLTSLKIVNVPLTAFAFLGGAVAIGIGFGAQNLFNNLISGFILMVQQPFKINDVVEFDGVTATVMEIDSRSTRVKTFDNYDVLVPNSYFLENKITNWTLSDKIIRGKLEIGVSYGTPAQQVEKILLRLANEHEFIIPHPEPFVLFSDYGSSSMDFTLYFWVDTRKAFPSKVSSDMRYRIQEIFEREGIEIPFPQMDVYLKKLAYQENIQLQD